MESTNNKPFSSLNTRWPEQTPGKRPFPRRGEIWKGKSLDGHTSWRILILDVTSSTVRYIVDDPSWRRETPIVLDLSLFLHIYTWESPCRARPTQKSSAFFKTLWRKVLAFFSVPVRP